MTELLNVAKQCLIESFGLDETGLQGHLDELMTRRFPNRDFADTVQRVARNPPRKLGSQERLAGLVHLLRRCAISTEPVSRVIGVALHYCDPADAERVSNLAGSSPRKGLARFWKMYAASEDERDVLRNASNFMITIRN